MMFSGSFQSFLGTDRSVRLYASSYADVSVKNITYTECLSCVNVLVFLCSGMEWAEKSFRITLWFDSSEFLS